MTDDHRISRAEVRRSFERAAAAYDEAAVLQRAVADRLLERLDVVRVPVQVDDANIAYLKDAVWVDKPARLFRGLLAETIRTRSNRVVIDSDDPALAAQSQLRGVLRDFGYDARTSSVVVRFDAIRETEGEGIETRRFESVIPGVAADVASVGPALNQAANDVAGQVAEWVG